MSRPVRILVADADAGHRQQFGPPLLAAGHTLLEAEDGYQALALAVQADLVVLDVALPGLDGIQVCRRLRQSPRTQFLPILLVMAQETRGDRLAAIEAGADDVLTMPVDRTYLGARAGALLRQKRQRDDAERLRSDFTSMIVHDLRSPLTSIVGFAELLTFDDLSATQREEFGKQITGGAEQMLSLINDLLDLNRLATETRPRRVRPIDLAQVAQDAVGTMQPIVADRHLTLALETSADLPALRGDERQVRQILNNLLDNAVKFARQEVHLTAHAQDDFLEVIVDDDGPGVPTEEWPQLFERWHQAKAGRHAGQGSGLGLAIAKRLVEIHGGTVTAGHSPSGGLRMTVALPLHA